MQPFERDRQSRCPGFTRINRVRVGEERHMTERQFYFGLLVGAGVVWLGTALALAGVVGWGLALVGLAVAGLSLASRRYGGQQAALPSHSEGYRQPERAR